MKYYKKIELDNFDIIQRKSLEFLLKEYPEIYERKTNVSFNYVSVIKFIEYCPEIVESFCKYKLTPNFLAAFVMYNSDNVVIHKDWFSSVARVNYPVLNCKNTFTRFYTGGGEWTFYRPSDQHPPRLKPSNRDFVLVDKVTIDQPTVIRVNEPHDIAIDELSVPRITFTMGFEQDPVFLLED